MAVATKNKAIVSEAMKLFEADSTRQPYTATHDNFLVSPENARTRLSRIHQRREERAADLRHEDQRSRR